MLLIELDGTKTDQIEMDLIAIGQLCEQHGSLEVCVAEERNNVERIWNVRRNIAQAFRVFSPTQGLEDFVVPIARIPDVIPELERLGKKYDLQMPCYGHAGDGNPHATLVKNPPISTEVWNKNEAECLHELCRITSELGGKITGTWHRHQTQVVLSTS